jgi:hypothetical protein
VVSKDGADESEAMVEVCDLESYNNKTRENESRDL